MTDKAIGRNEPCPCGSKKKYKRCCGVSAAPKLSIPAAPSGDFGGALPGGFDPKMLENFDPQMMMQMSQAVQRLPKGQLQRLQILMQKAMSGQDVSSEAEELERNLPSDFKSMMESFGGAFEEASKGFDSSNPEMQQMLAQAQALQGNPALALGQDESTPAADSMTEDQARKLVLEAAQSGVISKEQADELLKNSGGSSSGSGSEAVSGLSVQTEGSGEQAGNPQENQSRFGRFWKNKAGKK